MSRGIRKDTPERIQLARSKDAAALGPLLGELCTAFNITASMVADVVDSHDQTVLRWFFGTTSISPQWALHVVKIMCVLDWMRTNNIKPLTGTSEEKKAQFSRHVREFVKLAKRGG